MTQSKPSIQSTETCFAIIEQIQSNGSAGISELARNVNLSKSAVYKHVQTLLRLGYLVRQGDDYYLSLRFLLLGRQAYDRLPLEVLKSVVTQLAETTGNTTHFVARENDHAVYALQITPDGDDSVERSEGKVAPIHATAGGKAIFAFLDAEEQDRIIEKTGLPTFTDKTITDRSELKAELQSVRDTRIVFDREEFVEGIQSVASPVLDSGGSPIGSVSVTGTVQYMSGKRLEEDVVGLVISAAKSIEKEIRTA
ncbi:IclR family transcriptional regulator [Halocatena marina]|uniref:IclR family transcriptional regulator n=1 Tax=Halocatena marina TaxID=2934937 RepID=UPI00200BED46|nr:IclR family transcriptional regulator [Halocatena marina]